MCCKNPDLEKVDNCVNLMAGRCPSAWQVPRDCCPAPNDKYAHMLTTDHTRTDLVCCNAPCTAIEQAWRGVEGNATVGVSPVPGKAHCKANGDQMPAAVKVNCAPGAKSLLASLMGGGGGSYGLGGLGGLGGGGLDSSMISQLLGLPVGEGDSYDLGKVIPGMAGNTGLDGGATLAALQGLGFGSSKESHVDEITVDDFFDAIIEALDNDKDVFEYNKEINSDSWFGKQVHKSLYFDHTTCYYFSRSVALLMDLTSSIPRNSSTVSTVHHLDWLMHRQCLVCSMEYP